ncbi:MAG: M1 family metallopeptidase [Leeuwenhoekiella sp.]
MKRIYIVSFLLLAVHCISSAQSKIFTRQDSLRGSITPEREWWDLVHYDLNVSVEPDNRFISGTNTITYEVLSSKKTIQIDLQDPMILVEATQDGRKLDWKKDNQAYFISLQAQQKKGSRNKLKLTFKGNPKVAKRAPWDGGWTWTQDSNGKTFAANANQGIGASVWWPNKDIPYDEVDSLDLHTTVPKGLTAVGNGWLVETTISDSTATFHWKVQNPINNYGVNINIADYAHFSDYYIGEKDTLSLNYYVLPENLEKAKKQFEQVPKMLEAFEYWFGPYPFYEDGYKLVEVPYLGMEHQSSVTYGNKYANGYLGRDLSGTGWGNKFDFIIIHESGHEWFANNITNKDVADMWIHEGFTNYSENLYLDYWYGKVAASDYVVGIRENIRNDKPIIGTYGINSEGSGDMYYKGANILHTLRQLVEDDVLWRKILRGLNETFYHQTVTSAQVEAYISRQTGKDLTKFWDQYLRTTQVPKLQYHISGNTVKYRYDNIVEGFDMPIKVQVNGKEIWISPNATYRMESFEQPINSFIVNRNFYVIPQKQ